MMEASQEKNTNIKWIKRNFFFLSNKTRNWKEQNNKIYGGKFLNDFESENYHISIKERNEKKEEDVEKNLKWWT